MKEPQPGTCFAFPTPELAKYSSASSRCYSRKRHRSSWPFGRTGLGQERTHNPGSPGDGRASHAEGGRSPPVSSALLPGAPLGRTGRATRPGRRRPLSPRLLSTAPLRGRATRGEAAPHLLARLPSVPSARPAHLDGRRERELGDARPRGRTRLLPSPALPPGKQIPELNGNTQKVPSLTPNSTTRLG